MAYTQRSRSYNRINLSPLKLNKKHSDFNKSLFNRRLLSLNLRPFLNKLQSRNSVAENSLDASQIIKKDLLPMIESYSRGGHQKHTSVDNCHLSSRSEYMLSESLSSKLTTALNELRLTKSAQSSASWQIKSGLEEIQVIREKLEESSKLLAFLRHKRDSFIWEHKRNEPHNNWKEDCESILQLTSVLSQKVFIQKNLNHYLWQKESQLKHISCFLAMKNDVMGEQLKYLYKVSTTFHRTAEMKDVIVSPLIPIYKQALTQKDGRLYAWNLVKSININTLSDAMDSTNEQKAIILNIKNIKMQVKDKIQVLDRRTKHLTKELENQEKTFKSHNSRLEKLRSLYTRTKAEYKKIFTNQSIYKEEEKVCKNCRAIFTDRENFHWSCRIHLSEWSGNVYWCCGSTVHNTTGCFKCKHVSADDENEENVSRDFCSCCKEIGHKNTQCPKDANVKNTDNMDEELFRVSNLKKIKNRTRKPPIFKIPEKIEDWAELSDIKNDLLLEKFFARDNDNASNFHKLPQNKGKS